MKKQVLLLAVAATLFAAPVHAIKINEHAVTANGGNTSDIQGTAPSVFDTLRTASMASQFDAVGRLGDCTATWLGAEGDYAWVLTAARCVANTHLVHAADNLVFINKHGVALAGGAGSTSYIHPNRFSATNSGLRGTGSDIALVRLKRLPASDTQAPLAPAVYAGTAEVGARIGFVSYGAVTAAGQAVATWPTTGDRRAWGESMLTATSGAGHALVSPLTTGSGTYWAGVDEKDAGSPWFLQHEGQWQLAGVTSGGTPLQSNGVRVSKYLTWINDLFPAAQRGNSPVQPELPDNAIEVTEVRNYQSQDFGQRVGFTKSPGQPEVAAPEVVVNSWQGIGYTMTVPLTDTRTGVSHPVVLNSTRTNRCVDHLEMQNAQHCNNSSIYHVSYDPAKNPGLPPGTWSGNVGIDATHFAGGRHTFEGRLDLDIRIHVAGTQALFEFGTQNMGLLATSPTVYFTVPAQPGASGPTNGHLAQTTTGQSLITVQARDAVTGLSTVLKLRAQRINGCGQVAMNNAVACMGKVVSRLRVWFDASDNPSLQPSRYRAQFNVQARGWHDRAFVQTLPVNVDVNMLP